MMSSSLQAGPPNHRRRIAGRSLRDAEPVHPRFDGGRAGLRISAGILDVGSARVGLRREAINQHYVRITISHSGIDESVVRRP
jgi:hypothetical protein